jgi:hypothetical protein
MALQKTVSAFQDQIDIVDAYHKITEVSVQAYGSGMPKLYVVISSYKDKDSSDENARPLLSRTYELPPIDLAQEGMGQLRAMLYGMILAGIPDFEDSESV